MFRSIAQLAIPTLLFYQSNKITLNLYLAKFLYTLAKSFFSMHVALKYIAT